MDKKIGNLIICTDLFTIAGGIQRFNKVFYQAIRDIFPDRGQPTYILSLLDNPKHFLQTNLFVDQMDKVFGYHARKTLFLFDVVKLALRFRPKRIFFTHINFAPLAILIRLFAPSSQVWIVLHGFEAWEKINRLSTFGVQLCYGVLSVSRFTKEEFCKRNPISPDIVHVINLVSDHEWDSSPTIHNDLLADFPYILCVARLESEHAEYKGVDKTIEAFAALAKSSRLKGFHLYIVGEGDDRSRLESLAEMEGISQIVHFTGRIGDNELRSLYANCEMFVLPSTKEGFGLVYLEAMVYGKPVIASQYGASKEIVLDGQTGFLVPPDGINYLVEKISYLINFKLEREKLGQAGKNRYNECFTYQKFLERLKQALAPY